MQGGHKIGHSHRTTIEASGKGRAAFVRARAGFDFEKPHTSIVASGRRRYAGLPNDIGARIRQIVIAIDRIALSDTTRCN